eukprot:6213416-Pleurochrysis_carterae.AAC.3
MRLCLPLAEGDGALAAGTAGVDMTGALAGVGRLHDAESAAAAAAAADAAAAKAEVAAGACAPAALMGSSFISAT